MKLMETSIVLIILYTVYFTLAFDPIPGFLIAGYLFLDIVLLLHNYKLRFEGGIIKFLPYEGKAFIIFYLLLLLSGLLTSPKVFLYLDSIKNGIQYVMLFIIVYYIVTAKGSIDFPLKLLGIAIYAFALTAYFSGTLTAGRLAISKSGNANTLASLMYFGIVLSVYFWKKGLFYKFLTITYIPIALLNIMQAGSKTGFICTALFIVLFVIIAYLPSLKVDEQKSKIMSVLLFITVIVAVYYWLEPVYSHSILFSRLSQMNDDDSTVIRIQLYKEAFRLFKEYPIFGIGYDNFKYLNQYGTYSHSTYGEVLASSGIVGTLIYFSIYLSIIKKLLKLYAAKINQKLSVYREGILLSYMLVGLVFATSRIDLYEPITYVWFACMAGYYDINKRYLPLERNRMPVLTESMKSYRYSGQ